MAVAPVSLQTHQRAVALVKIEAASSKSAAKSHASSTMHETPTNSRDATDRVHHCQTVRWPVTTRVHATRRGV